MGRPLLARILCAVTLCATLCQGRPKTDLVKLVNGNELTCEIRRLSRGVLSAKTDSLSAVSIRWEDVVQVRSDFVFEIVLTDGTAYAGALTPGEAGHLVMPGGAAVPLLQVVDLIPIGTRISNRFNGAVEFGYSFLKSSTTTQMNFDADLNYSARHREVETSFSNLLVVRENTATTRRSQADLAIKESLPRGLFLMGLGQYSRNDELNLIHRYLGGGALGKYFIRTNRSIFSGFGGAAYSSERYAGAERANNAEALFGINSQTFRLFSPKLDITGEFRYWPNLKTSGRYRMDAHFDARIEVYKNLFLSLSFFDNYDRKNPTTSSPLNDYGAMMSIGYSFNR